MKNEKRIPFETIEKVVEGEPEGIHYGMLRDKVFSPELSGITAKIRAGVRDSYSRS